MINNEENPQEEPTFPDPNDQCSDGQIIENYQERDKNLKITFYRLLGLLIVILSIVIVPLIVVTYFYHPGQSDNTALLIEQIVGYILAGIGIIIGSIMLSYSIKLRKEKAIVNPILIEEKEIERFDES